MSQGMFYLFFAPDTHTILFYSICEMKMLLLFAASLTPLTKPHRRLELLSCVESKERQTTTSHAREEGNTNTDTILLRGADKIREIFILIVTNNNSRHSEKYTAQEIDKCSGQNA